MTRFRKWMVPLLLSAQLGLCNHVSAAEIWVDQMIGFTNRGLSGGFQGNYAAEGNAYALRALFFDDIDCCTSYGELSVSYGFKNHQKYSITTYQAGIGIVQKNIDDGPIREDKVSLAIPFSVSMVFGNYVGFGVHLHVNINRYQPLVGVGVGWSYGKMRK